MSRSDKDKNSDSSANGGRDQSEKVNTGGWDDSLKVRLRTFNGPAGAMEALRISMSKEAYADVLGHAKESLDKEICGVLLGNLCEDEYGYFLDVEAAIRGGSAKTGGTHVTFTQETWNEIHEAKEQRYPKLHIVGWYHSHPGFGVEFSDMDLFIQKNFFGGPSQVAFVTDPLGGQEAIIANVNGEISSIKRFWVDGRERRCFVPASAAVASAGADGETVSSQVSNDVSKSIEELRDRVRQLTEAVEQHRTFFYNFLTFLGMLIAVCFLLGTGYSMWRAYSHPFEPPEELGVGVTPVIIDGKEMVVGVSIKGWRMPSELQESIRTHVIAQYEAEQAATRAATQKSATAPDGSTPTTRPDNQSVNR